MKYVMKYVMNYIETLITLFANKMHSEYIVTLTFNTNAEALVSNKQRERFLF